MSVRDLFSHSHPRQGRSWFRGENGGSEKLDLAEVQSVELLASLK
jgi:hypothetical protein